MSDFLPHFPDASTRDCVRALLRRADYSETAIAALFGVATLAEAQSVAACALPRLAGRDGTLGMLLHLFLDGGEVEAASAGRSLGADAVAALLAARMLRQESGRLAATLRLTPVGELVVASDRRALHAGGFADFVVGPAPVSRILGDLLVRDPAQRSLDLGCGSGVLALLAAAWSREVVAADVNPRAVAYLAFNADLNGLDQVRGVCGDLFAPLAGERFERIVCNPPFVISPAAEFVYRDGGTSICRRIIDQAPDHLAPGGILQMLCNWPEPAAGDWREVLADWFADRGCDVWVLRLQQLPATLYAAVWLRQEFHASAVPAAAYDNWMEHLEGLGAARIASGLVLMRPAAGRRPWLEMRDAPFNHGLAGTSIARVLDARDRLARLDSPAALLDLQLRPIAGLQQRTTRGYDAGGWRTAHYELRAGDGFAFAARVDPVLAALVTRLDGQSSLRRVTEDWADDNGLAAETVLPQLPGAVGRLLSLGLLEVL